MHQLIDYIHNWNHPGENYTVQDLARGGRTIFTSSMCQVTIGRCTIDRCAAAGPHEIGIELRAVMQWCRTKAQLRLCQREEHSVICGIV